MSDDDSSAPGPEPRPEASSGGSTTSEDEAPDDKAPENKISEDQTPEDAPPADQPLAGQPSADGPSTGESSEATGAACQNCGTPLAGEYCHRCGQRDLPQLRLRDLGRHFLETVLDVDDLGTGLRRTLIEGLRNPGALARQYADGKRKQVVSPIGYFLIAVTLTFVVYEIFQAEWVQGQAELMRAQWEALGVSPDKIFGEESPFRERYGWTSASDLAGALFSVIQQVQTYFGVLVCLIAAGVLRGLFSGPTYADLVVFELYTVAQASLLQALLVPVLQVWSPAAIFASSPALLIGLHLYSGPGFFGSSWKGWAVPPLAAAAALVGQALIVGACGLVWMFVFP